MSRPLGSIVAALGGTLVGSPDTMITRLAPLASAAPDELAFVAQARYAHQIQTTQAGALIVTPALQDAAAERGACIVTDDPYLYFARLTQWWRSEHEPLPEPAIDPLASIHPLAVIEPDVDIAAFAVIGPGARVARGARIGAHVVLGRDAVVGADTTLHARVTVGERCVIGARCTLHPGAVIGADGFGFAPHQGRWIKIEQLGAVRIGNDVEIGANTCIDRGALDDTVIEDGVKLDNLVQIGHNVHIGAHTAMAGCVGVAGSATIGAHCTVGGGAVVLGHLSLADGVNISAATVVTRSIREPGHYTGVFPIDDNASWEKNAASLKQLNRLRERLKAVEQAIAQASNNTPKP
ncbi:MAG: UDP-3-O-(3-hydroxymyristoyl)glucosamine N-acyltransferase [Burkholderiales bacterium RIFCSPLOWO2_12_67_14]|nr:MAG: UDP-3-O-(3-hydroxymyristoyl)glucosamine N-acyltransferase [Burkholderiales bacterium RIFCSPLOWO2_02_FULL_67_64]OGB39910.1 MAG: UDP-3-O-(3-hydroxymyristoyl)glucosamine N-acyltransferase [Burkholderiales bacterium RIFCSPLOWO2_12_67_14]OGB52564.1 MAG: UDP-3-O-(3-hydroxymyristoyl)glucosamine N-acyltransferase [Burkholderiales bacterium RIFCSPHIGHO2_12_FULL_67_38]OGB99558.1 MAG: UDP-3-O-(3-hydroxymyristoyl)glucosamine N-acyltransferase [Burkholderiales bacterium RIFCSPLOWO2_12_FULL_67_210]